MYDELVNIRVCGKELSVYVNLPLHTAGGTCKDCRTNTLKQIFWTEVVVLEIVDECYQNVPIDSGIGVKAKQKIERMIKVILSPLCEVHQGDRYEEALESLFP